MKIILFILFITFSNFSFSVNFYTNPNFINSANHEVICNTAFFNQGTVYLSSNGNSYQAAVGDASTTLAGQGWGNTGACGNGVLMVKNLGQECPAHSTLTGGACVCTAPKVESPDNNSCVDPGASCPEAGSSVGQSGYIDVGTSPLSMPPRACDEGCPSQYVGGGVEYSRLIDGVKHYYVKGGYIAKAGTCVDGEPTLPRNEVLDADGCTSSQSKITMGGRTKCIDSDTNTPANPNSASAVADAKSLDDAARAAAIDAASSAAAAAGLDAAGIAAAAAGAASNYGSGGSPNGSGNDPVLSGYCKENPTAKICADDEFGTVDDSEVTNQDRSVAITPVPIGSSGVCPAPTPFTIAGRTGYFSWTTYCNFASGIKPILLVFAWLSAAGILIGGLRD